MSWNTHIPKFRRFVLQNFPFIEEDFDALTDYALICKVVEYLNQVIDSQNGLISEVETFETNVSNEVNTFETNITNSFNRLEGLFNDLQSFVNNYFDNLDVQAEINNKLDAMVEDGTLQEIITTYIQSNVAWTFDTVADMNASTNLINGSYAHTLGYYSINDNGGSFYKIVSTQPDTYYETLSNGLYAQLILEPIMNVKQFGCKGDGETDDTARFNHALSNSKTLVIDSGIYLIDKFLPYENQEIMGNGNVTLDLNGTTPPLAELPSNFKMNKVKLNCINEDLNWNRTNISGKSNIIVEDCSFVGFRNAGTANSWGILIGNSSNITIRNCYFNNNSQSDIAMVNGCKNIVIDQCSGDNFYINIEPDGYSNKNKNITIQNCDLYRLSILENQFRGTASESIMVENCKINHFIYRGGTATILNCEITNFENNATTNVIMGGRLNLINTGNFTKNILVDPYLDRYENDTSSSQPWVLRYSSHTLNNAMTCIKDQDGIQTVLNPNNLSNLTFTMKSQHINVTQQDTFLLRVNGKGYYPEGSLYISLNFRILWYDSDNQVIKRDVISFFRSDYDTTSPFSEETAILNPPETTSYMVIEISTAFNSSATDITTVRSFYLRSIQLHKINSVTEPNTLEVLPIRDHRIFDNDVSPNAKYTKYLTGDRLYFTSPSTYLGQVATTDGYGSSATWKNFGALSS